MKEHLKTLIPIAFLLLLMISCNPEGGLKNPADYELYISISADQNPSVSPDGSLIAYFHWCLMFPEPEDYPTGLYVMKMDGTERRLLLRGRHFSPSWSPDGQWLVFTSDGLLQIINLQGDIIRTFQGENSLPLHTPDWSKDGKEILFNSPLTIKGGVFAMTPDFSHVRQILHPIENNGMHARWSPDRSKIVFSKGNQAWESIEIFTIDTSLTSEVRLTNDGRDDRSPSWSPTGDFITWSSNVEIFRMSTNGSNRRRLDYGQFPSWLPDGKFIVYSNANYDYTKEVLWKIDINGNNKVQLTF
ncbi:MAG: hypothetical protein U1C46_02315 [Bacteroidales bacterium]|nr:hypothetical protein [Bacteroidales bacterium]MDZ4203630.1 hypothetical protein [Bacteroidales bacterium]